MDRKTVISSDIESIGYKKNFKILEIKFLSGGLYQYTDVPESEYDGIMNASSHGKYFHKHIKDHFDYKKLS